MTKSIFLQLMIPLIINSFMILMLLLPMKNYKFHPLNLMIILIIHTFLISNYLNMIFKSWMSYILFLTMIGGLMIIFMYITSLTNNKIFMMNYNYFISLILKFIFMIFMIFFFMYIYKIFLSMTWNTPDIWNMIFIEKFNEIYLSNIFYYKSFSIFFLMNYLFYSMICIMNICYKFNKPLRQMNQI